MSEQESKHGCPGAKELELFSLDEMVATKRRITIAEHLHFCPRCQRKYRHFKAFYATLSRELDNSFSPGLIDYCKHRAPRQVKYGLLLCTPLPAKNKGDEKAFLATISFSANGDGSKNRLIDFDLHQEEIGIMLYTDPGRKELLLFLWGQDRKGIAPWRLSIPGISVNLMFNPFGFCKMPLIHIENFHNQLCFFSLTPGSVTPQRVLQKIQNMIA